MLVYINIKKKDSNLWNFQPSLSMLLYTEKRHSYFMIVLYLQRLAKSLNLKLNLSSIMQREERDGVRVRLSYAVPMVQWASLGYARHLPF